MINNRWEHCRFIVWEKPGDVCNNEGEHPCYTYTLEQDSDRQTTHTEPRRFFFLIDFHVAMNEHCFDARTNRVPDFFDFLHSRDCVRSRSKMNLTLENSDY